MSIRRRLVLVPAYACVLVACGGGGGGDAGPGGAGAPTPAVPSPPQPLPMIVLDGTNAISAASRATKLIEHAGVAVDLATTVADIVLVSNETEFRFDCNDFSSGLVNVHIGLADNDGSGALSPGDVLTAAQDPCGGVSRTMSLTISTVSWIEGRLEGELEFEALRDDGELSEATLDLVSVFDAASNELNQSLENLSATTSDVALTGRAERFVNTVSREFSLGFAGEVESTMLGGRFAFETIEPFMGTAGEVPTRGVLVVVGENSQLRVEPSADETISEAFFDYRLDPSGLGEFRPTENALWRGLVDGIMFGWDGNAAPRISSLSIGPEQPTTLDELFATYTTHDLEGDSLTLRLNWWRNSSPLAPQTDVLPIGLHSKGDTIRVSLELSDGKESSIEWVGTTIVNAPPSVTAYLSPEAPTTVDRLRLTYGASDPDRDSIVDVTFEWARNGVTVPGETTQFLDASRHGRDDLITGIVRVSDGELSAMGQTALSILDTPVVVSLPSPANSVDLGDTVSFDATAFDADADPIGSFELTHGPSGMTIDAATGRISWTAVGPSFGRGAGFSGSSVSFGVTSDAPGANVVTYLLSVIDRTPEYPLMLTGIYPPLTEGIEADDLDNDGVDELVIVSESAIYTLDRAGSGYAPSWSYPFALRGQTLYTGLASGDIDGDGRAEIFAGESNGIYKFSGAERAYADGIIISMPVGRVWRDIELADVNNDGRPNLIGIATLDRSADPAAASELVLMTADTMSLLRVFNRNDYGSSVAIGNVDGDAALEIVTGGGYVVDGATRVEEWRHASGFGQEIDVGDLDGDGLDEIVGSVAGSIDIYDVATQSLRWSIPNAGIAVVRLADLTADGFDELIVGDGSGGAERISAYTYDGATDDLIPLFTLPAGTSEVTALAVGDTDGDGDVELVWGSAEQGGMVTVADTDPALIEWTNLDEAVTNVTGPFIGGQSIEAPAEATRLTFLSLTSGAGGPSVVSLDPLEGLASYGEDLGAAADTGAAMTAVDYDNDGTTETLVAVSPGSSHYQLAYDGFAANLEWASALISNGASVAAVADGDLTGDARADLVVIDSDGVLRVYDVANDALVWQGPMLLAGADVALAELNGGGLLELVVAAAERVHVYTRDGGAFEAVTTSHSAYPNLRDIEVGDVDGDGIVEIFALYGAATSVARLDVDLIEQGGFDHWRQSINLLIEASPYPRKNLILVERGTDPQIVAVDPESGIEIWASPKLLGPIGRDSVHFVELSGETAARIAVATELGVLVTR